MDGYLEQARKNKELLIKEDEDQLVDLKEEVEKQDEEAPVSSETSTENEVVEVYEPGISYLQRLLEVTKEDENPQPTQELESVIERYEEKMKKSWEDQQTSSIEAFDEDKAPTITQQPCLNIQVVKTTNKNIKERIVTKLQLIISRKRKRSTTNNPTPEPPASKLNQAIYKKKLAGKRPRKGKLTSSSLPLRSFLLTNWKKRKKVISYMSVVFLS
ncbi:hypothetical protein AHAS_Ahas13G0303000 [Arachis hypogaea]